MAREKLIKKGLIPLKESKFRLNYWLQFMDDRAKEINSGKFDYIDETTETTKKEEIKNQMFTQHFTLKRTKSSHI